MTTATRPSFQGAIKNLRVVGLVMAVSIPLYVYVAYLDFRHVQQNVARLQSIFWILGVSIIAVIAIVRRSMVQGSVEILQAQPEDAQGVQQFMNGHILTFVLCEAVALYGFVIQGLGGTLLEAAPFYAAGFLLMLFFIPRSS